MLFLHKRNHHLLAPGAGKQVYACPHTLQMPASHAAVAVGHRQLAVQGLPIPHSGFC